uniref:Cytochrome P450 n=1 Tax=Phlebotomus papatasi TaxID=29031 RepID=A0A1B0D226_PHLPP
MINAATAPIAVKQNHINLSAKGLPCSAMYLTPWRVELLKNSLVCQRRLVRNSRRRCMGENLAKSSLFIFFATFMHVFEMRLPDNEPEMPDLDGVDGITLSPKPYRVILSR